jgi:hydrogenase expression/formation protein HypE
MPSSSAAPATAGETGTSASRTSMATPEAAEAALAAQRGAPGGEQAAEIGEVRTEPPGMVLLQTAFGGRRVLDMLVGDPLPRIC